jgi:glutaredoxin
MAYHVNVFSLIGCSHCKELKSALEENNIPFTDFEVNEHRTIYDQILAQTKMDALPTVYIQNDETGAGPILVAGRDFLQKSEAIEKIKNILKKN